MATAIACFQHSLIDAAAVIAHAHVQSAGLIRDLHHNILRPGVAEGVGQRLTPNQQNFLLHDLVQRPRAAFYGDLKVRRVNGPQLIARLGQGVGQAGAVDPPAAKIQYSFASFLHHPVGLLQRLIQSLPRRIVGGQPAGRGVKAQRQPEQTLQKRIVQLPGDALPLRHSFGEPALKLTRDAADAQTDGPPQQSETGEQDQRREPPRLIESRFDGNSQTRSNLVPHPIVVAGDHMKSIVSRGQPGVEGLAARAYVLPFGIDPIELVAEEHPVGNRQAERGVVNLQPFAMRRKRQVAGTRVGLSIGDDGGDQHRGR